MILHPTKTNVDPMIMALANRRKALGLSYRDICRRSDLHVGNVYAILNGQMSPRLPTLRSLADALGCDLTLTPKEIAT